MTPNEYNKKNHDTLVILLPKNFKVKLKEIALKQDISMNKYINRAIKEKIAREETNNNENS